MSQEALIILDASVVAQPNAVSSLTDRFQSSYKVHRQVLDRLSSKTVLPNHYAYIYVAPENVILSADNLQVLFDALSAGGRMEGPMNYKAQTLNAIMTGFVENDTKTGYTKPESLASTTTILRKQNTSSKKKHMFKRAIDLTAIGDDDDEDDLVDEDSLISSSVLSRPIVIPAACATTAGGKKRRKACKDCTCGLKEFEQQELEKQQQSVVTLNLDEEVDFTVPGKPVGSCGSCALGDAFRCDGCPYLGLPPFKPGEIVSVGGVRGDY
ncbi:hypothetical protein DV451_005163 [Geotrichum candidum]|uniref:Fe-S cluster assembly protein DRE2 n=1 Tax=Geotrichum candidum TaxID=1173061 RepID=A0A9P5FZV3_GEOCN|nr:hypothetical protein DV451_005163 [Geotrichum candidum]KAF5107408.1 hypothetical protein DV453_003063 [Geotrichum candidum]